MALWKWPSGQLYDSMTRVLLVLDLTYQVGVLCVQQNADREIDGSSGGQGATFKLKVLTFNTRRSSAETEKWRAAMHTAKGPPTLGSTFAGREFPPRTEQVGTHAENG